MRPLDTAEIIGNVPLDTHLGFHSDFLIFSGHTYRSSNAGTELSSSVLIGTAMFVVIPMVVIGLLCMRHNKKLRQRRAANGWWKISISLI